MTLGETAGAGRAHVLELHFHSILRRELDDALQRTIAWRTTMVCARAKVFIPLTLIQAHKEGLMADGSPAICMQGSDTCDPHEGLPWKGKGYW